MSGRYRKVTTGTTIFTIAVVGLGWMIIWTAPWWIDQLFPEFLVWSREPWRLTEADLTTQRVISNLVIKPGFRVLIGITFGIAVVSLKWVIWEYLNAFGEGLRTKLPSRRNMGSTEFVVEGRRASLLVEFAREVEAV